MKVKNYYTEMLPSSNLPDTHYIEALAARVNALAEDARERGYYLAVGLHHLPVELVEERAGAFTVRPEGAEHAFVAASVGALSLYSEHFSEEKVS